MEELRGKKKQDEKPKKFDKETEQCEISWKRKKYFGTVRNLDLLGVAAGTCGYLTDVC